MHRGRHEFSVSTTQPHYTHRRGCDVLFTHQMLVAVQQPRLAVVVNDENTLDHLAPSKLRAPRKLSIKQILETTKSPQNFLFMCAVAVAVAPPSPLTPLNIMRDHTRGTRLLMFPLFCLIVHRAWSYYAPRSMSSPSYSSNPSLNPSQLISHFNPPSPLPTYSTASLILSL